MIEIKDLTKYYGETKGIEGLNFKVKEGEVFGYLGPNGAGKTTTIRLLVDLIRPTRGEAFINGYSCQREIDEVKENMEYLPGNFTAYGHLTCDQYLKFVAGFYGNDNILSRGRELAQYFELDLSRRIGACSQGMKQKLGLIQVFMIDCPLYILDEPTSGLDPLVQQKFYKIIEEQKTEGKTIFLSSHILSEVERICDRVAIIREGELIEVNYVDNLRNKKFKKVKVVYEQKPPVDFFDKEGLEVESENDDQYLMRITSGIGDNLHHLTSLPLRDINVMNPSLEEIFLSYYGERE